MADLELIAITVFKEATVTPVRTSTLRAGFALPSSSGTVVIKDSTLDAKRTDTGVRSGLGLSIGANVGVLKDKIDTTVVDDGVRSELGFLPKFLGLISRIDGTETLPSFKKTLGTDSMMNPKSPVTYISGTVTEDGLPSRKLLRLYDKSTGHLLSQTYSSETTGDYIFNDVSVNNQYYIIAFDEDGIPLKEPQMISTIQK